MPPDELQVGDFVDVLNNGNVIVNKGVLIYSWISTVDGLKRFRIRNSEGLVYLFTESYVVKIRLWKKKEVR